MDKNFICKKIDSLLNLYLENKLSANQIEFVEQHLKNCESCRLKYEYMKKLVESIKNSYEKNYIKDKINTINSKEFEAYKQNISAYLDNELSFEDSVKFKKYLMKTPHARKEIQNVYKLQQQLKKHWENSKKKMRGDLSKIIVETIFGNVYSNFLPSFAKLVASFVIIVFTFGIGVFFHQSYKHEHEHKQEKIKKEKKIKADISTTIDNKALNKFKITFT